MSLARYKQKRSAQDTPEPFGGKPGNDALRFVVQKHAASHLHYDFRLEVNGVLKSWAVPKGPSLNPTVKRLAMMVEDHPYDYRSFEGAIPKGQYGGGTVIVWDEGTFEPDDAAADRDEQQKILQKGLRNGKLKFRLYGKKLKGKFALVKAPARGEQGWLLMKLKDGYASTADVLREDHSVLSGKTVEEMEKDPEDIYGKPGQTAGRTSGKSATTTPAGIGSPDPESLLKGVAKKKFFDSIPQPMLATLVKQVPEGDNWIYEVKWDGYRALAYMNKGKVAIRSRNNKSFDEKFYPIHEALSALKLNAVLDGEIVTIKANGKADFGALQNWRSEADGMLVYYVFDLLWYEGRDVTTLPLVQRKELLGKLIAGQENIRISEGFRTSGQDFLNSARQMGLEGIMAKKQDSPYRIDSRSGDWLKIKANKSQEVVIGGFTRNEDSPKPFSSLLVGVYEGKKFVYTGKVGTGFSVKTQKEILALCKPLIIEKSPFSLVPDINKPSRFRPQPPEAKATWLKPQLVCEVHFTEITTDGVMRHPSFKGLRNDKAAKDVVLEREQDAEAAARNLTGIRQAPASARKTLLNPTEDTQVKTVLGHKMKFTNLNKIFWPETEGTKRDLLNYYYQVAPFILPYLVDRPMSLNRFPNGISGKSFYQKDMTGKVPDWMETYRYHSQADKRDRHFLVCKTEADLLYMANLASIEMNPWSSRIATPENPDWCVLDLDPDKNTFDQVIECARVTHDLLKSIGVPSYCKTSGSTGLHIYIPLGARYEYEASKEFARTVATRVHRELPRYTTIERLTKKRGGKMYIDFLQNRPQATLAAPYSVRPKPGATVSMPLHWDEVKKGLKISDFTIYNAMARLKETGDLFRPVIGEGIDLDKAVERLNQG